MLVSGLNVRCVLPARLWVDPANRAAINHSVTFVDSRPSRVKPHEEMTPDARSTWSVGAKQNGAQNLIPLESYVPNGGLPQLPRRQSDSVRTGPRRLRGDAWSNRPLLNCAPSIKYVIGMLLRSQLPV